MLALKNRNLLLIFFLTLITSGFFFCWKFLIVTRPTTVIADSPELKHLLQKYSEAKSDVERYDAAESLVKGIRLAMRKGEILNFSEIKKCLGEPDFCNSTGFYIAYDISVGETYAELSFYTDNYKQRVRKLFVSLLLD